jgi:hypothetical protein
MSGWGQRRARHNAQEAARELARRRAEIEDVERFLLATRSSIARWVSLDEEAPPSLGERRIPRQSQRRD